MKKLALTPVLIAIAVLVGIGRIHIGVLRDGRDRHEIGAAAVIERRQLDQVDRRRSAVVAAGVRVAEEQLRRRGVAVGRPRRGEIPLARAVARGLEGRLFGERRERLARGEGIARSTGC